VAAQAFSGIRQELHDEAAGLFNLVKTLGFSIGVTIITTLVYRGTQANWARYAGQLNPAEPGYTHFLQQIGYSDGTASTGALMTGLLGIQAGFLGIIQTMEVMVVIGLGAIPLTWLLKVPRPTA
jgi:DHA2 family multidrug resistance protein